MNNIKTDILPIESNFIAGDIFVGSNKQYYILMFYPGKGYMLINLSTGGFFRMFKDTVEEAINGASFVGRHLNIKISK